MPATSSVLAELTPPWLELPQETTAMILHKLGAIDILMIAQTVCTTWWRVCQDASMWRSIDIQYQSINQGLKYDFEKLCCHAVDRSQGQLIDIKIDDYGTNDLLLYISERSNQLKSLRLIYCDAISHEVLIDGVKKLPLLEELELSYIPNSTETIEVVGRSCPHLKLFKLNSCWYKLPHRKCDMDAFAVAQNMHELRHLQLFGNKLTDEGLKAILDGCPNLESLDPRQCFNVRFGGNLGKLCSRRIKDLRRPDDSTDDYGFDAELC